jgi:hypothetical protein
MIPVDTSVEWKNTEFGAGPKISYAVPLFLII